MNLLVNLVASGFVHLFEIGGRVRLQAAFLLVVEALHTLQTSLRALVFLLKSRNLCAHRVQFLQLVLKPLLLGHELHLRFYLLRVFRHQHVLH